MTGSRMASPPTISGLQPLQNIVLAAVIDDHVLMQVRMRFDLVYHRHHARFLIQHIHMLRIEVADANGPYALSSYKRINAFQLGRYISSPGQWIRYRSTYSKPSFFTAFFKPYSVVS